MWIPFVNHLFVLDDKFYWSFFTSRIFFELKLAFSFLNLFLKKNQIESDLTMWQALFLLTNYELAKNIEGLQASANSKLFQTSLRCLFQNLG